MPPQDVPSPDDTNRLVGSDRVLAVLKELSSYPEGVRLEDLARRVSSPKSTVHRALGSLRRAGFATQDAQGHYLLGDDFLRIAFAHHEARPDHIRIYPVLEKLAERFGETTHYAVLDGYSIVYRSKVDPPTGAIRLTSTVGGRNPAHSTGVGKALLAHRLHSLRDVRLWIGKKKLEQRTPNTKRTAEELHADLEAVRARGYAVDDQENEVGINCIAFPVYLASPTNPSGAVSISAVAYRTSLDVLLAALPEIKADLAAIS